MNKQIFQVPAQFQKASTLSHSVRIIFDTQENITQEQFSILFGMASQNNIGWLTFSSHIIEPENIVNLPPIKQYDTKSPSQRLRSTLYVYWSKDNYGYSDFNQFYEYYINQIIERLKEKII